jgi:hypothetical protein
VHQPDVHCLVVRGQVEQHGHMPGDHHDAEQRHRHPGPEQEAAHRPQRARPPATQGAPGNRLARAPRQPIQQRLPGSAGHHQGRRRKHQQQVLEHVYEEVVIGPVVDR